jgi:hypothetical protein
MGRITIDFLSKKSILFPHVCIVGAGGTGGLVVQQVSQLISVFNKWGKMIVADYDYFEEKNLANQLCLPSDIGKNKAEVLARRYRSAYQIDISTYSSSYIEDLETLDKVFDTEYEGCHGSNTFYLPILISCVDNNYTRKIFHQYFMNATNLLYIDVGNESVNVPKDFRTRTRDKWTTEEIAAYDKSGYTGQLVCGLKIDGKVITEPISSVFPDILEDNDEIAPSQMSCQDLAASEPQRLITSRYSAMAVNTIINEVFETNCLSTHKIFYHSKLGYMRSEQITEENV